MWHTENLFLICLTSLFTGHYIKHECVSNNPTSLYVNMTYNSTTFFLFIWILLCSDLTGCVAAPGKCGLEWARGWWLELWLYVLSQTCESSTLHLSLSLSSTRAPQTHPDCRDGQCLKKRKNNTLNNRCCYLNKTLYILVLPIKRHICLYFCRLAVIVLTSWYDNLPVCAIRLHGLNDVFFGVTPVDPIPIQIVQSQPSRPAQVLLPHQHLSVPTVHPRWFYSGFPAPVCPVHHSANTEIITETKHNFLSGYKTSSYCTKELRMQTTYFFTPKLYILIPDWWIDNNSSGLVQVCVDQPLPVASI